MNEAPGGDAQQPNADSIGFWDRHAKLSILLIAGVFYVVLLAMCLTVGYFVWQS